MRIRRDRGVAGAAMLLLACIWAGPAAASSDGSCATRWSIDARNRAECGSTTLISPANDSRVNLLMLLHDRHGSVGTTDFETRDYWPRRGDARPFDFFYFASRLATGRATPEPDENAAPQERRAVAGTRCQSNESGKQAFIAAVRAARGMAEDEKSALIALRETIDPQCNGDTGGKQLFRLPEAVRSARGRAFANYADGAAAFYAGSWISARAAFTRAAGSDVAWLREAATYMVARTALNQAADEAVGRYGDFDPASANAQVVEAADQLLDAYLSAYANGRYARSARGLLRRAAWLGGRKDAMLAAYVWQFAQRDAAQRSDGLIDLVQEFDARIMAQAGQQETAYQPAGLPLSAVRDPMVLAVLDIKAMRQSPDPDDREFDAPVITRAQLEGQRALFAGHDDLYAYVLANHAYYVDDRPDVVLSLIPAAPVGDGYLDHSRRLLRAMALGRRNSTDARAAYGDAITRASQPLQRGTAEMALALHEERHGGIARIFAANSPVRDSETRSLLLRYGADAELLRQQAGDSNADAGERAVALFTLLYKQLTRGRYADFVRDYDRFPRRTPPRADGGYGAGDADNVELFSWTGAGDFTCPDLRTVAVQLAQNPRRANALLCLGEFVRTNGLDPAGYGPYALIETRPGADELGGAPSLFAGERWSRLSAYRSIIADPAASADDKAYALYRAVNCYAPSGYNGCDSSDVPQQQRRAWFQLLKTRYRTSPWAERLRYYW